MEYFIRNDCAKLFDPQVFHGASFKYLCVYRKISRSKSSDVRRGDRRNEKGAMYERRRREREKKRKRFIPWHSVRLNLLTRFQAASPALQPFSWPLPPSSMSFSHSSTSSSSSSLVALWLPTPPTPSVQPFSPWNLGWHLVNRENDAERTVLAAHESLRTSRCERGHHPLDSAPRSRDTSRLLSFNARRIDYGFSPSHLLAFVRACSVSFPFFFFSCQKICRIDLIWSTFFGNRIILLSSFFCFALTRICWIDHSSYIPWSDREYRISIFVFASVATQTQCVQTCDRNRGWSIYLYNLCG